MIISHFSSEILTSSTPIMILFMRNHTSKWISHTFLGRFSPQVLLSWYNPWGTIQVNDYLTLFLGDSYLKYSYHDIILEEPYKKMIISHFSSEILTSSTPIMILFMRNHTSKWLSHTFLRRFLLQVLLSWYNSWGTIQVNEYLTLFFRDSYLKYSYHDIIHEEPYK